MPASTRVIPANEYRRMRWRNGAGWTREIHAEPSAEDWTWRLSIAEIEQDAPFSCFPGVDRELVLLSGNGQWVGKRLRFTGEASAAPGREAALANLLNIIGRRSGARSIITVG